MMRPVKHRQPSTKILPSSMEYKMGVMLIAVNAYVSYSVAFHHETILSGIVTWLVCVVFIPALGVFLHRLLFVERCLRSRWRVMMGAVALMAMANAYHLWG